MRSWWGESTPETVPLVDPPVGGMPSVEDHMGTMPRAFRFWKRNPPLSECGEGGGGEPPPGEDLEENPVVATPVFECIAKTATVANLASFSACTSTP